MDTKANFKELHDWMGRNDAIGAVVVPGDLEAEYNWYRESEPDLPEWGEAKDTLMRSTVWRKSVSEAMSAAAFEVMDELVASYATAVRTETA